MASSKPLKIAIVSLAIGRRFQTEWDFSAANKRNYCSIHGYDFLYHKEVPEDFSRPASWYKLLLVEAALASYDYVLWMDADAVFTRFDVSLENIFSSEIRAQHDFVFQRDWNHINMGVFFVKSTPWSRSFLLEMFAMNKSDLSPTYAPLYDTWWEQAAVVDAFENSAVVRKHVFVDREDRLRMNQYPSPDGYTYSNIQGTKNFYQTGDVVLHFCNSKSYPVLSRARWMLDQVRKYGVTDLTTSRIGCVYQTVRYFEAISRWIAIAAWSKVRRSNL